MVRSGRSSASARKRSVRSFLGKCFGVTPIVYFFWVAARREPFRSKMLPLVAGHLTLLTHCLSALSRYYLDDDYPIDENADDEREKYPQEPCTPPWKVSDHLALRSIP